MTEFDAAWSRITGRPVEPAPEPKVRTPHNLIEPTPEEAANGWTAETLTKYVREREQAANERLDFNHPSRRRQPPRANGHRWRFPAKRSWTIAPSWRR